MNGMSHDSPSNQRPQSSGSKASPRPASGNKSGKKSRGRRRKKSAEARMAEGGEEGPGPPRAAPAPMDVPTQEGHQQLPYPQLRQQPQPPHSLLRQQPQQHQRPRNQNRHSQTPEQQQHRRNHQGQSRQPHHTQSRQQHHAQSRQQRRFEPHWEPERVAAALEAGQLVEGNIRVNPKNYEDAYVPDPNGKHQIHMNFLDRNRALNGDRVAVFIKDKRDWIMQVDAIKDLLRKSPERFPPIVLNEIKKLAASWDDDEDNDNNNESGFSENENVLNESTTSTTTSSTSGVSSDEPAHLPTAPPRSSPPLGAQPAAAAAAADPALPPPAVDRVREQLPPEIRSLVDKMEKSWRENGGASAAAAAAAEDATRRRRREGSFSVENNSLANALQGTLETPSGLAFVDQFPDDLLQKTGKVVFVSEPVHTRTAIGVLKPLADGNRKAALFSPKDHRLPRMLVPIADCPADFLARPNDHAKTLFVAKISEWKETSMMAHGCVVKTLGDAGEIEPEHEGLLLEHGFDSADFADDVLDCLPSVGDDEQFDVPEEVIRERSAKGFDFRAKCVFSVDPATARDLDDALHCESLGDGVFEVGVHIADVSYFVESGTRLDEVASHRATSVYMVHRMIPMLPRLLCERLCSLQPGVDRLSFSVVWRIKENGEILDERFGSSIIRSCAKLAYEHAQGFIDEPNREWKAEELPEISGGWTSVDLAEKVGNLQRIAKNLRLQRFKNGALRLDQIKLAFTLHPETRMPIGYRVYDHNDSHRLIEEFMLLANMAVAHRLNEYFPEKALLRRHPPPQENLMESIERFCESLSIHIDISSSGALQKSLQSLVTADGFSAARLQVLTAMFARPMQLAEYFCAGKIVDPDDYHHYALNVPLYTHFTSPIRRYPDVVVHRMLKASLSSAADAESSPGSVKSLSSTASRCNKMKAAAKKISEASAEIFFALYVKHCGPVEEKAMVMSLLNRSFDILLLQSGVTKRVYLDRCGLESYRLLKKEGSPPQLRLKWPPLDAADAAEDVENRDAASAAASAAPAAPAQLRIQTIDVFDLVDVVLKTVDEPLKFSAILRRPEVEDDEG